MKIVFSKHMSAFFVCISLLSSVQGGSENIKDTYQIVHDNYKHMSLAHGCIAWETGVIRRLYDFGQIFPVYKQVPQFPARQLIDSYEKLDQTHMTVRLVHTLFYRVPGSTSDADFGITGQLNFNEPKKIAENIAQVLALIEALSKQDKAFHDAVKFFSTRNQIWQTDQAALLLSPLQQAPNAKPLIDNFAENCRKLKVKASENQVKEKYYSKLVKFSNTLKAIKKLLHGSPSNKIGLLKPPALQKAEMAHVLLNSVRECSGNNAIYMPHTTQTILLAFVYKACGNDRSVLADFYGALDKILQGNFLKRAMQNGGFKHITQEKAVKKLEKILVNDTFQREANIENQYEQFVYCLQQIKSFPTPVGYAIATFITPAGTKISFANCMENAIRNFINSLSYNPATNCFELEYLKKRMNYTGNFHADVEDFYKKYKSPSQAASSKAHNKWTKILSNIPHAMYVESADNGLYNYNLRACIKTLIIVLDHVLNLNLFGGDGVREVTRMDFIAYYFPRLSKALGAQNYYFSRVEKAFNGDDKLTQKIDQHDLGRDVYSTIVFKDDQKQDMFCEFKTYNGHGEFKLYETGSEQEKNVHQLLTKNLPSFKNNSIFSIVCTEFLSRKEIFLSHVAYHPLLVYNNFFAMPLENTDRLEKNMCSMINVALPSTMSITKALLLRLIAKQPDESQRKKMFLKMLSYFFSFSINNYENYSKDIVDSINEAIAVAQGAVTDNNNHVRLYSLLLFKALVNRNQGYQEAIVAAQRAITDNDYIVRLNALLLFKDLVNRNQGYQEAIVAAQGAINYDIYSIGFQGFKLFKALVNRNQGFQEALTAAQGAVADNSSYIRSKSLGLFKALVEKGQAFVAAENAAITGIRSKNELIQGHSIKLAMALAKKGHGLALATVASSLYLMRPETFFSINKEDITDFRRTLGFDQTVSLQEKLNYYRFMYGQSVIKVGAEIAFVAATLYNLESIGSAVGTLLGY